MPVSQDAHPPPHHHYAPPWGLPAPRVHPAQSRPSHHKLLPPGLRHQRSHVRPSVRSATRARRHPFFVRFWVKHKRPHRPTPRCPRSDEVCYIVLAYVLCLPAAAVDNFHSHRGVPRATPISPIPFRQRLHYFSRSNHLPHPLQPSVTSCAVCLAAESLASYPLYAIPPPPSPTVPPPARVLRIHHWETLCSAAVPRLTLGCIPTVYAVAGSCRHVVRISWYGFHILTNLAVARCCRGHVVCLRASVTGQSDPMPRTACRVPDHHRCMPV